jgi:multidrug efflux pump subunit AcrA (membrane-fusion protein)
MRRPWRQVKVLVAQTPVSDARSTATIKSRNSVTLMPQVEGQVTRIFVKSGDYVEAGASISRSTPWQSASAQPGSHAQGVQADGADAQPAGARPGLTGAGIVSKQELDQA